MENEENYFNTINIENVFFNISLTINIIAFKN
jgi:hypothetical protein